MKSDGVEFRVLGPLEVARGGEQLALGGAKQRAVLAVLLLRAGEVVPLERLIDEVWGNDPPPSAAHTVESYVSRLRQLLNGSGPIISRRGVGYAIDLHGAQLDALAFAKLEESATLASALDEHANVVELASAALAIWRGPALADVALASAGRSEAERLEELRLRTYELRFDAELALGHHEQAIGELQALVVQNPYRERFVAQFMLALYRAGRHAEALDAYEKTRRRLDDDLGLQPSADLQQLSGQIVRQDPLLKRTTPSAPVAKRSFGPRAKRRPAMLVAAAAAVGASLVLAASGGAVTPDREARQASRIAVVLPNVSTESVAARGLSRAVETEAFLHDLDAQVAYVDPRAVQESVGSVVERLRGEGVGLVVALGDGPDAQALARVVRDVPETRFLFVDISLRDLELEGVSNAAAIRFGEEDVLLLGGYASGLIPTRDGLARRIDRVSFVAGAADRKTARLIAGFTRGLRETSPGVTVRIDYSHELDDPTACERLANRQIDQGSDVVVALSGRCGLGAVEVARIRGVWAVGAEEDGVYREDGVRHQEHILLATYKNWVEGTKTGIEQLIKGSLPMGRDTVLGLEDDYLAGVDFSERVPEGIMSATVDRCSQIRATRHRDI